MTTKTKPAATLAVCSRLLVCVLQVGPSTELKSTPVGGWVAIGCDDVGSHVGISSSLSEHCWYDQVCDWTEVRPPS